MFVALFIFQVFPEQIIGIFGQESDLYVEFAVKCFRIYLLACFLIPSGAVVGIFSGNRKAGSGCGAYSFKADYPVDSCYADFRLYNGCGRNFMGRPVF